MKTVVIGVSSGIAAYKTLDLIASLKKDGLDIVVVMTKSATKMISPKLFQRASGNKVYTELFEKAFKYTSVLEKRTVDHIQIADKANLVVIAPATANTIAKIAHGIADDFLTTMLLATAAPVLICPSMNVHMWNNPLVQENIVKLQRFGFGIIDPTEGELACGYFGKGRLADMQTIRNEILNRLAFADSLKGKRILVTSGPTTEKIDDVRYITNKSSGKMGVAIAQECFLRGADVLLLRSELSAKSQMFIKEKIFQTADELFSLLKKEAKKYDMLFHVAAVSDFELTQTYKGKLSSKNNLNLQLKTRKKIVDEVKKINPNITLIAFKAEWELSEEKMIQAAQRKMEESRADAIVVNDVSKSDRGFQADTNEVIIVFANETHKKITLASKKDVARHIVDIIIA